MADLVTQITESVELNGSTRGSTNVSITQEIDGVVERILTSFASTVTTIATFASQPSSSPNAIDVDRTKYVRVTNLDDVTSVNLQIVGNNTNTILLPPKGSFIINGAFSIFAGSSTSAAGRPTQSIVTVRVQNEDKALNANIELFVGISAYVAPEPPAEK
tara:strand:+ start:1017 stop:1496 length:480 start_codon:yes stop_codon:yes gene_type:complete